MIFNGFIKKLKDEISSFLTGMAFPHPHPTKGCGNAPFSKSRVEGHEISKLPIYRLSKM